MARRNEGAYPQRSVTEEQRSQAAFSAKTLRAADLLPTAGVGSAVTARYGDAPASPPRPSPKSLAAGPHGVFKQALCAELADEITPFGGMPSGHERVGSGRCPRALAVCVRDGGRRESNPRVWNEVRVRSA